MLTQLSDKVRGCLEHAENCANRARIECDPNIARDFLEMERRWLRLARSYQFAEHGRFFQVQQKATRRRRSDPRSDGNRPATWRLRSSRPQGAAEAHFDRLSDHSAT